MGRGKIDGRQVVVIGDDFTVRGGSADATIKEKPIMAERMANEFRLPIIRIIEGSGGGGSVKTIETTGRANLPGGVGGTWLSIRATTWPGAGGGARPRLGRRPRRGAARRHALLGHGQGHLGDVRRRPAGRECASAAELHQAGARRLGDPDAAGAVDDAVDTEEEAFAAARRFLSYLPSSVYEVAPRAALRPTIRRGREESWLGAIPRDIRKPYRMRPLIEALFDRAASSRWAGIFGRSVITGFARLDGLPVAVMAGDPISTAAPGPPTPAAR